MGISLDKNKNLPRFLTASADDSHTHIALLKVSDEPRERLVFSLEYATLFLFYQPLLKAALNMPESADGNR